MTYLEQFIGQYWPGQVQDAINQWAAQNGYDTNIIPDGVDNIDVEPRRLNVWLDGNTSTVIRFTVG